MLEHDNLKFIIGLSYTMCWGFTYIRCQRRNLYYAFLNKIHNLRLTILNQVQLIGFQDILNVNIMLNVPVQLSHEHKHERLTSDFISTWMTRGVVLSIITDLERLES